MKPEDAKDEILHALWIARYLLGPGVVTERHRLNVEHTIDKYESLVEERDIDHEDPTIEDALDGALAAATWCDDNGREGLADVLHDAYQQIGEEQAEVE